MLSQSQIQTIRGKIISSVSNKTKLPLSALLVDCCSELSCLVADWILEMDEQCSLFILKGENVFGTRKSHDVIAIGHENGAVQIIDPTVWQFIPEKESILILEASDIDGALVEIAKIYGGKWLSSGIFEGLTEGERAEYARVIQETVLDNTLTLCHNERKNNREEMNNQKISMQPPRGMRDFYPADYRQREVLFNVWKEAVKSFGFEMYDAPVVESLDLLKRKAGEEIVDQIYAFEDKSGRELALRPEMTPSLARMVISGFHELRFPLKWSAIPQCFRYERMTVGRKREHYQWNVDILGESSTIAEAELIAVALASLKELGLTSKEVIVRVGSRKILTEILTSVNFTEENIQATFMGIDKRGKIPDEEIQALLIEGGLSREQTELVFKVASMTSLDEVKQMAPDIDGVREFEQFLGYVEMFGNTDWIQLDLSIVRGLSYYTGIVFEANDRDGKFRAIFGGGRYDGLIEQMGGQPLEAVGLGFGDVVIHEVLNYYGKAISSPILIDRVVYYTDESLLSAAVKLADTMRASGLSVRLHTTITTMKKALANCDALGVRYCAIVDAREAAEGKYLVKDLETGEQEICAI